MINYSGENASDNVSLVNGLLSAILPGNTINHVMDCCEKYMPAIPVIVKLRLIKENPESRTGVGITFPTGVILEETLGNYLLTTSALWYRPSTIL